MNIYQILPGKSVRHGLVEIISQFPEVCAVEYGPEGTMHYLSGAMAEKSDNVFTSGIHEKNVIFGSTDILERAVCDLDARKHPAWIFLIASCVSEIIGTDLGAVARCLSSKVGAKVFAVDNIRLDLDYSDGYRMFCRLLARHVLPDVEKSPGAPEGFTMLGFSPTDFHGKADRRELRRMLGDYLGLPCRNGPDGSIRLQDLAGSRFNLVLRQEAMPLAEAAKERFGTPYICACPYGIRQTQELLDAVSMFSKENYRENPIYQEDLQLALRAVRLLRSTFAGKKNFSLVLHGDLDRILALSRCFREEGMLENQTAVCAHHAKDLPDGVLPRQKEADFMKLMAEKKPALLISSEIYCRYFRETCKGFPMFSPVSYLTDMDEFAPFMGLHGLLNLAQSLTNTLEAGGL